LRGDIDSLADVDDRRVGEDKLIALGANSVEESAAVEQRDDFEPVRVWSGAGLWSGGLSRHS
jgi:hypothetical protein